MKKKLFGVLFLVLSAILINVMPVAALDPPPVVSVHGTVTDYVTGQPVIGAKVNLYCDGHLVHTTTTNKDGSYQAMFSSSRCALGSELTITGTGDDDKAAMVITTIVDHEIIEDLRLAKGTVIIPEYGWMGGIVAASAGIGVIIYGRRRLGLTR